MTLLDAEGIAALLDRMAQELVTTVPADTHPPPAVVGIHTGGLWIAHALHQRLAALMEIEPAVGSLDIAFYRDDFSRIGMNPRVRPSDIPFTLDERPVILVDDVLYTGRTIRAALGELFDYGRPAMVRLAVLVDRGGHELPVRADVTGMQHSPKAGEHIKLSGPEPLALHLRGAADTKTTDS